MAAWPDTLPQQPDDFSSFAEDFGDGTLRSEMDVGPAKVRKRTTAVVEPVSFTLLLTASQVADLKTFHKTTTNFGADVWTWVDHLTGEPANYRFVKPPSFRMVSQVYRLCTLNLEIVP